MIYLASGKWFSNVLTNQKILIRHVCIEKSLIKWEWGDGVGMWKRETMELEDIVPVTLFTGNNNNEQF